LVLALAGMVGATIASSCSASSTTPPPGVGVPGSLTLTSAHPIQTFTMYSYDYSGPYTATSNNTAVATVSPTSPPNTFRVTGPCGVPPPGTTTISVSAGGEYEVTVNVTNQIQCN
jgi:hypothetical protein